MANKTFSHCFSTDRYKLEALPLTAICPVNYFCPTDLISEANIDLFHATTVSDRTSETFA